MSENVLVRRFKCEVTRVDEYIVEIDETVINEAWMAEFRKSFYSFMGLADHARHLAQFQARFGSLRSPEGYGMVKRNGEFAFTRDPNAYKEEAINIVIVSEDDQCEAEVTEVTCV